MHLWTYNPKSPNLSVFKRSFSGYFSSLLATLSHTLFTSLRLTDTASPCLWYSLMLYLVILWVIWLYFAAFCTHVCKNFWTEPLLHNLLHSGTLRESSNQAHFLPALAPWQFPTSVPCAASITIRLLQCPAAWQYELVSKTMLMG